MVANVRLAGGLDRLVVGRRRHRGLLVASVSAVSSYSGTLLTSVTIGLRSEPVELRGLPKTHSTPLAKPKSSTATIVSMIATNTTTTAV